MLVWFVQPDGTALCQAEQGWLVSGGQCWVCRVLAEQHPGDFGKQRCCAAASVVCADGMSLLLSWLAALRSCVWSEPSVVESAAYEFAETAKFLDTGE